MADFIFLVWMFASIAALIGFIAPRLFRVKKRLHIAIAYAGCSFAAILGIDIFNEPQPKTIALTPKQKEHPDQICEYIDTIPCSLLVKGSTNPWDTTAPITESSVYASYDSIATEDAIFTIPPNTKVVSSARYILLNNTDTLGVRYHIEHEEKKGWVPQGDVEELR